MIILDTNVLSALMSREPDRDVVAWLDQQAPESVWTTSITVFEIRLGLALMDAGASQLQLTAAFETLLAEDLTGRVLNFDSVAAARTAILIADLQKNRTLHRISGRHDLRNRTRPASRHRNPQCPPLRADSGVNHQPLGLNVAGSDVCVGPLLPLVPVKSPLTHATWIDGQTGQRLPDPRAPPQSGQPG